MNDQPANFSQLNDSALISLRAQMRAELEQLPPRSDEHYALTRAYDASTAEIDQRARQAWGSYYALKVDDAEPRRPYLMDGITPGETEMARARLLAVEVLLTEPETLGNDALEGDLYILRDHLTAALSGAPPTES